MDEREGQRAWTKREWEELKRRALYSSITLAVTMPHIPRRPLPHNDWAGNAARSGGTRLASCQGSAAFGATRPRPPRLVSEPKYWSARGPGMADARMGGAAWSGARPCPGTRSDVPRRATLSRLTTTTMSDADGSSRRLFPTFFFSSFFFFHPFRFFDHPIHFLSRFALIASKLPTRFTSFLLTSFVVKLSVFIFTSYLFSRFLFL